MANLIDCKDLRLTDFPEVDDDKAVWAFASSFNGYMHYGSFEATASAAKKSKREALTEIRNELFMYMRATNHQGSGPELPLYAELRPLLVALLK